MANKSIYFKWLPVFGLIFVVFLSMETKTALSQAPPEPLGPQNHVLSVEAESIYDNARPRLLQIRTLLNDTGQQTSIGSAFLVDPDGLAITNYHVVSMHALEPETYRLDYATPDGSHGPLSLLAFDVVNDLAVVRIDKHDLPYFKFSDEKSGVQSLKGQRLYAMGNPLNLGFAIVEGTYNGMVDHSYNDRIYFSGALNPGMSGGPAVTANNKVIGVNVSKRIDSELISFLVPARFAVDLINRAKMSSPAHPSPEFRRAEISAQLLSWQDRLYKALNNEKLPLSEFGPYLAQGNNSPWFTCWSTTNSRDIPKPTAIQNTTYCKMDSQLFVTDDVNTGSIRFAQTYAKSTSLNAFQFATFLTEGYDLIPTGNRKGKYYTQRLCHEDFVEQEKPGKHPLVHVVWCAQAYRDVVGFYDVSVLAVTQDNSHEALISRLSMKGVDYSNAMTYARRFLGALQWNK